ncbi:MAG: insulinase family protein [Alistipes indistinctus]
MASGASSSGCARPSAHCAPTVNTGSRDELPSEYGLAHPRRSIHFSKARHTRKSYHINCRLENLGGELNA